MRTGPDIARIGALVGDPARANMLAALMSGQAMTAGELAREAGIGASTASFHLKALEEGGMVAAVRQGRHRYYALAGPDVAAAVEALMGLSAAAGPRRTRFGPREPELRAARTCYDHLAGALAVRLCDALTRAGALALCDGGVRLGEAGQAHFRALGLVADAPESGRLCLDWSERRPHLGGALGRQLLVRFLELGWVARRPDTRALRVPPPEASGLERWLRSVESGDPPVKLRLVATSGAA